MHVNMFVLRRLAQTPVWTPTALDKPPTGADQINMDFVPAAGWCLVPDFVIFIAQDISFLVLFPSVMHT